MALIEDEVFGGNVHDKCVQTPGVFDDTYVLQWKERTAETLGLRILDEKRSIDIEAILTGFGWKHGFIVKKILDPCHDIVNVGRCGKMYALALLVYPSVTQSDAVKVSASLLVGDLLTSVRRTFEGTLA